MNEVVTNPLCSNPGYHGVLEARRYDDLAPIEECVEREAQGRRVTQRSADEVDVAARQTPRVSFLLGQSVGIGVREPTTPYALRLSRRTGSEMYRTTTELLRERVRLGFARARQLGQPRLGNDHRLRQAGKDYAGLTTVQFLADDDGSESAQEGAVNAREERRRVGRLKDHSAAR